MTLAQEMLGIMSSKYSGINGAVINPSLPVLSPFFLDINLVSAGLFTENNYLYLAREEYMFSRFLESNPNFPTHPPDNKFYYDYYTSSDKRGFFVARVMGPSVALISGRNAFGFYTSARTTFSAQNIPMQLAKFFFEGLAFPPQYDTRFIHDQKMSAAGLAWGEAAFNYSRVFQDRGYDFLAAGITVKRLFGNAGGYWHSTLMDYMVPHRDTLIIYNTNTEGGFSIPLDYTTNEFLTSPLFRGTGIGFDIGMTFERKRVLQNNSRNFRKLCSQVYVPYQFRIGISLLDIGSIKFTENAMKLDVENGSLFWPGIHSTDYSNVNQLMSNISNRFFGNPTQLITDNEVVIGLPTALSIQADVNIQSNFYGNATVVYPVKMMKNSVVRPMLIALGPRYETRNIGFGVIASVHDWNRFHLGINGRIRGFFFGTEKIGSFFRFSDFTGIDFYGGLKISFMKGHCRNNRSVSCSNNEYKKFVRQKGLFKNRKPKMDLYR